MSSVRLAGIVRWSLVAYRCAGALILFSTVAMAGSVVSILLHPDAEGWDSFAAAIGGLVWGAAAGAVAAAVFVFLPAPVSSRAKWLVLGALFVAAALTMTILETVD